MAYADIKARLLTHARTAGAALTPPLTDVQLGLPVPTGRCARVWYGGETDPKRMGGRLTLNSEMVGQVTMIAAYWPLTALEPELARTIDAEAQAFAHALRTAIDGDISLNGTADNTTLGDAVPDYPTLGNTRYFMFAWEATTDYIEYAIAKP
jgi:hypothetical protein